MHPDDLNAAERALWSAFPKGEWVDLRGADEHDADERAPAERAIRAEVISALLLGACPAEPGHFPAVRLRGARVAGRLDLMGATVDYALVCEHCSFEAAPRFVETDTRTVRLVSCLLPGFNGARIRVSGILSFAYSTVGEGVRLDRGQVSGEVNFRGAQIGADQRGNAIAAAGLTVDGPLECTDGFVADGTIDLRVARIGGALEMTRARIAGADDVALAASEAVIDGRFEGGGLRADGEVLFRNAQIAGSVRLPGARLSCPSGAALSAGGVAVAGGVWCHQGFQAEGEIRLVGAQLRANISLRGAKLSNPGGKALNLERAELQELDAGGLNVDGGTVSLTGARVASFLNLRSAALTGGDVPALVIEGAAIGTLNLQRMRATGQTFIQSTTISGRVFLKDAHLDHPAEVAMRFNRNEVAMDVDCNGLTALGEVRMVETRIGRLLSFDAVRLVNPDGTALNARMLQAAEVVFRPGEPVRGSVNLEHARIGLLRDDPSQWPAQLHADGLVYETLQPALSARERLGWLASDPAGFQPQPYEQLAGLYTRNGQHGEARKVLYAKERRQRATLPLLGRLWGGLQDVTVAYGYQPWRAALWLALLLTAGSVVYGISPPPPLKPGEAPHFNPVIYTLDLLLPIVDLSQEHARNPAGAQQWLSYLLIAAGWILATTIAAGVARVLSRR